MERGRMRDFGPRRYMDGRNPYGSRGGYVRDSRRRDRAMRGDYGMDYLDSEYGYREHPTLYRNIEREERKYENTGAMDKRPRQYDGNNYYPIEVMGRFDGYYGMDNDYGPQDYGYDRRDYDYYPRDYRRYDMSSGEYLPDQELKMWQQKLMETIDEKDKPMLKMDIIKKKAQDMGIKFDEFTEDEFYTVVLMKFTDHCKTLGTSNIDVYLKLAKDFLTDTDVAVKGSEKLAEYYYSIVMGE